MGRHRAITGARERELAALLDAGVTQQRAAELLGVGLRTVNRWAGERARSAGAGETLEEILAGIPSLEELLAGVERPRRRRRRRTGWEEAAVRLEAEFPDRWASR
jgi:hypothetical protein